MQATTAALISAIAGSVSAIIASVAAFNSYRSARSSVLALQETREQRSRDAARAEIVLVGTLYDEALALTRALASARSGPPEAVETARAKVRRSMLIAGVSEPELDRLLAATAPLSSAEVDRIRSVLTARVAVLRTRLTTAEVADAD